MSNPIDYGMQNYINYMNVQPSQVKGTANLSTAYWKRVLWQKIYSRFRFTIPAEWDYDYFNFLLFRAGSIGVIYTKKYGWICQPYNVLSRNMFYKPYMIEVWNQFITSPARGIVGVNAGIIHVMPDYYGLEDIVTRFAQKLASCDKSIDINLMNSNVALLYGAEGKKEAETIKEAYAKATEGEPLITINKDILGNGQLNTLINNVGGNFIAGDVLQLQNSIMNQFLTTVGIRNANYDKKERLNSQEVEQNVDDTKSIITTIYDTIKRDMDTINTFSGLGLSVELRDDYEQTNESEVKEDA